MATLFCSDGAAGLTATLLCSDGAVGSTTRTMAHPADNYKAEIFVFFLLGSFNGLFYVRKKENDKLLYAQKSQKEKERKSFETCSVYLFSALGSPPPILALLVGSQ
jgi:hypothetical protein